VCSEVQIRLKLLWQRFYGKEIVYSMKMPRKEASTANGKFTIVLVFECTDNSSQA